VTKPLALLAALLVSSFCGLSMAKTALLAPSHQAQITVHDASDVTRNEVAPGDVAPAPIPAPVQPRPTPTQPPEPPPQGSPRLPRLPLNLTTSRGRARGSRSFRRVLLAVPGSRYRIPPPEPTRSNPRRSPGSGTRTRASKTPPGGCSPGGFGGVFRMRRPQPGGSRQDPRPFRGQHRPSRGSPRGFLPAPRPASEAPNLVPGTEPPKNQPTPWPGRAPRARSRQDSNPTPQRSIPGDPAPPHTPPGCHLAAGALGQQVPGCPRTSRARASPPRTGPRASPSRSRGLFRPRWHCLCLDSPGAQGGHRGRVEWAPAPEPRSGRAREGSVCA
jgi:hypothetical protein